MASRPVAAAAATQKPSNLLTWMQAFAAPPPGEFDQTAVRWEAGEVQFGGKGKVPTRVTVIPAGRSADFVAGEGRRGACKFLLDKCVDQRNDVGKFCFGSLPSEGLKRGNAQTVLLKQYYQCDHGPEDHRMLADVPPAKKQRVSKKQRGLSHKVGCKVRFTLTVRMRNDLQPYCEVTYMEAEHTGHVGVDAMPHQRQQRRLSDAAAQHVVQCLSLGTPPTEILSTNMLRIKREWLNIPSNAADDADFLGWLEAHPESQEARDAHLTRQDIRNIQNRVPSNLSKLQTDQAVSVALLIDAAAAADEGELLHVSSNMRLEHDVPSQCHDKQPG